MSISLEKLINANYQATVRPTKLEALGGGPRNLLYKVLQVFLCMITIKKSQFCITVVRMSFGREYAGNICEIMR